MQTSVIKVFRLYQVYERDLVKFTAIVDFVLDSTGRVCLAFNNK